LGFTLPIGDAEGTKDVLNLLTDFDLSTVGNELGGSATTANVILQSIDELLVSLHAFNITNKGLRTDEKLRIGVATVNGWSVRINSIGSDGLVASMDVEGRMGRFEATFKICTHGHAGILSSASKGLLHCVEGQPTKVGMQRIIVRVGYGDRTGRWCGSNGFRGVRSIDNGIRMGKVDTASKDVINIGKRRRESAGFRNGWCRDNRSNI
jgi:hypothetical protein